MKAATGGWKGAYFCVVGNPETGDLILAVKICATELMDAVWRALNPHGAPKFVEPVAKDVTYWEAIA